MSIGCFSDKAHQPSAAEIDAAIGSRLPLWRDLVDSLRGHYPVQEDFRFLYGKKYGWGLRFRVSGKLLTSLYPRKDGFAAQINLSPAAVAQAQALPLRGPVQQAIARATPYPEGRWVFVVAETEDEVRDIRKLVALRAAAQGIRSQPSQAGD